MGRPRQYLFKVETPAWANPTFFCVCSSTMHHFISWFSSFQQLRKNLYPRGFQYFAFWTHLYFTAWQVLEKSVCGNILGANVINHHRKGKYRQKKNVWNCFWHYESVRQPPPSPPRNHDHHPCMSGYTINILSKSRYNVDLILVRTIFRLAKPAFFSHNES